MSRTRRWNRRPALRRAQAALTALAFVLAGAIGLVHEATTTHVRCAEHGELTDADPGVTAAAVTGDAAVLQDLAVSTGHGHDHCLIGCAARIWTVQSPVTLTAVAITETGVAFTLPPTGAPPAAALYLTAPKTSPPA